MTIPSPREPDAREALADELEACPAVPFLGVPGELKFIAAFAMTEANRDVIVAALREQPNEREREALADAPDDDDNTMRDDPMFNRGVDHVVDMLARTTGAKNWHAGDGSEDYDCDLEETLRNILADAGLYDKEEGVFAALRQAAAPGGGLPEIPDDDADFTPDLARKIIAKYQAVIAMRNIDIEELRLRIASPPPSDERAWKCKANPTGVVPSDCDWPGCGCDPHAERVIRGLIECGWEPPSSKPSDERAKVMEEMLNFFTRHYEPWMDNHKDEAECIVHSRHTFGDLRRARAALFPSTPPPNPFREWRLAKEPKIIPDTQPRVADDDNGGITVTFNGRELRGWSYANDAERRTKMMGAREYVEGWCDGRETR